ncbi:MAG: redoxin domain-containing protein [Deltaproteobacteria bacterium]|nr:redoxin domain-containing protein [Deltaproteobacteria bacterium]
MKMVLKVVTIFVMGLFLLNGSVFGQSGTLKDNIYDPGKLKPRDSDLKVKAGQKAPDFTLPAVSGKQITLSYFRGKRNVVLSFVPAAFTPVCSEQWPGYNLVKDIVPTLHAWTQQMGKVWFEVLSDFWPHGAVADKYGVLRSDGLSERALFFIDKEGIINAVIVMDINRQPDITACANELKKMNKK